MDGAVDGSCRSGAERELERAGASWGMPRRRKLRAQAATGVTQLGSLIPALGLGTCCPPIGQAPIVAFLRAGGAHLDTSLAYANHREIAEAIRAAGTPRAALWITSKMPLPGSAREAMDEVRRATAELGTCPDLFLIHHPTAPGRCAAPYPNEWRAPARLTPAQAECFRTLRVAAWRGLRRARDAGGLPPP